MDLGISQEETQMSNKGNNDDNPVHNVPFSCSSSPSPSSSSSHQIHGAADNIEKEHMFDKVVTPSDVGKLNRLVIPKLHAEKYFPLDPSANDKGLLLNFEDRNGKSWRFRYSYWNSSQSYVMTKGWSRFVKEKKLDAGDIVSFQRGLGDAARDRLFIDWRRRPDVAPDAVASFPYPYPHPQHQHFSLQRSVPWNPMLMKPPSPHLSGRNGSFYSGGGVVYLGSAAPQLGIRMAEWQQQHHRQQQEPAIVLDSIPVVQGKASAKRLRLFGVNMECPLSEAKEQDVLASATAMAMSQCGAPRPPQHPPSSSHQLRLYNADKGKSSISLDLDI